MLHHPFYTSEQSLEGWMQIILPHFEDALEGQVKWFIGEITSDHTLWQQHIIIPRLEVERVNQYIFYPQNEGSFEVKLINDLGEFLGEGIIGDQIIQWDFNSKLFQGKEVYSLNSQQYDYQVEYVSAEGAKTQIHGSIYPV